MMIAEYKETVLHELEKAADEEEVEQVINRSVERFPEKELFRYLVIIYLHILQSELQKFSEQNVEIPRKGNIRHALSYLRKMNDSRSKVE